MAETVLYDVAAAIVTTLGSHALQKIGLWWGVKDELDKLRNTVSTIQAVLLDAEEQSWRNNQVKNWLGQLKEALYDADDLLDDFSTEALRRQVMSGNKMMKEVRLFFSSSNQLAYGLKMAHKIKVIRDRLDEIAANRRFHLVERPVETPVMAKEREQTHSSLPEIVVGREDDKKAIVQLLLSSNYEENVSFISIVGIGGLGKTTLAQFAYNDENVQKHFELKLWVCVSDNFDVKLIVEKILEAANKGKPGNLEMNTLKDLLHEKIRGKRYLLVLDDIWNEDMERWSRLKDLLVVGARGSKIMITTRIKKVAEIVSNVSNYELKGLPEKESWSLFTQMALKRGQVPRGPRHEAIGKEIVAKCAGVPLAIKTIGRLLYFKDTESEWESLKNKELSELGQRESDIIPTLKLSYNHLPVPLKHCFAYCRLFPKDYKINVKTLINHWIAQGYIKSSDPSQCLEDIGLEYFMDLLWRSFFQEVEEDKWGNIETYKMHDLMHDLAMQVAGAESALSNPNAEYVDENTRHISLDIVSVSSRWQVSSSLPKARKLRSFLLPHSEWHQITGEQCDVIFSSLRRLRVLDLHHLSIEALPHCIKKFKHLRHLDLSWNEGIKRLPNSITRLQNLQVLKLAYCSCLEQLPKNIKKLVNLRHIDIDGFNILTHMPSGLGQLTFLQELSTFMVANHDSDFKHSSGLGELHGLNNLRGKLEIINLRHVKNGASEFKAANLKEKQHLQVMRLQWGRYPGLQAYGDADFVNNDETSWEELQPHSNLKGLHVDGYGGVNFPSWLSSLTNLVELGIINCKSCWHLPPLDQFPFLKKLLLHNLTDLEYIACDVNYDSKEGSALLFFPSLKDLTLLNCTNLKGWRRKKDSGTKSTSLSTVELPQFHCLSNLYIHNCPNLTSMPQFPYLEELRFLNMKSLEQIISVAQSSSSSPALSQLKFLRIENIEDLEFLLELLPNLVSLETLKFYHCPLENLCNNENNDDGMQWQALRSLHLLYIYDIPKLVFLPKGLQHVTTLHSITIFNCPNMTSLPEWIGKLNTLHYIHIDGCPQLSERCRNNMGADWPKIAHIPYITMD